MQTHTLFAVVGVSALLAAACGDDDGGPVDPNPTTFTATLSRLVEVPPCLQASPTSEGSATLTLNGGNSVITVSNVTFSGLSSAVTAVHLHFGATGEPGPAILTFTGSLASPITNRTFTASSYPGSVPEGSPETFSAFAHQMRAGQTFINVHTQLCPDGEVRGQLIAQ